LSFFSLLTSDFINWNGHRVLNLIFDVCKSCIFDWGE